MCSSMSKSQYGDKYHDFGIHCLPCMTWTPPHLLRSVSFVLYGIWDGDWGYGRVSLVIFDLYHHIMCSSMCKSQYGDKSYNFGIYSLQGMTCTPPHLLRSVSCVLYGIWDGDWGHGWVSLVMFDLHHHIMCSSMCKSQYGDKSHDFGIHCLQGMTWSHPHTWSEVFNLFCMWYGMGIEVMVGSP